MEKEHSDKFKTEVKEYLRLRKELLINEIAIKAVRFTGVLILMFSLIILVMGTLLIILLAAVSAIEPYTGVGIALIMGGAVYICLWLLIYALRRQLILNPLSKFIYNLIVS